MGFLRALCVDFLWYALYLYMNINICIRVTDGKDGQLFCYQPLPGRTNEEQGAPSQTLWDGIKAPWWKVLDSSWIHWMGGCSATQLPMGWIDGASVDIMQGWPTGSLGKKQFGYKDEYTIQVAKTMCTWPRLTMGTTGSCIFLRILSAYFFVASPIW